MSGKIDELKQKLDDINSRVDSMCREMCTRRGLDYDSEFKKTDDSESDKETDAGESNGAEAKTDDETTVLCKEEPVGTPSMTDEEFAKLEKKAEKAKKEYEEEVEKDTPSEEEFEKNKEYVKEFKHELGYKDDYFPETDCRHVRDLIAHEYALEMPTDTEAREVEGDAVMLLVMSKSNKAVKVGKTLGDILMNRKNSGKDSEKLLEAMRQAFLSLGDVINLEEAESQSKVTESFGGATLYDRAKMIFESVNGKNEDGSDYGFDDFIRESVSDGKTEDITESRARRYIGGRSAVSESADWNPDKPSSDEIMDWFKDWKKRGSNMSELDSPYAEDMSKDAQIRRCVKKILKFGGNGKSTERKSDSASDGEENGWKKSSREIHGGMERYVNQLLPKSIRGLIRKGIDKIPGGSKVTGAYDKLGGLDSLALGTLGGLTLGPVGAVIGAGLGKGIQKLRS